jgi:ABC-type lipoprotein release transport system permease subunit
LNVESGTFPPSLVIGAGGSYLLFVMLGQEVSRENAFFLVGNAAAMVVVAVLAAIGPARRGMAVQPTEALKGE